MPRAFCQLCGQPIEKRGHLIHHPKWPEGQYLRACDDCFRRKPHCRICGMPILENAPDETCPTCVQYAPHCLSCGRAIVGRYLEINGAGPYCLQCHEDRPACDVCGAPLGEKRWQLSDGRVSCEPCHSTAVYEPAEARAAYDEVTGIIQRALGLSLNVPTGLALVDHNQLTDIIRKQNGSSTHDMARTLGIYARRGVRRGIYVQTGLPRVLLAQIAAHEYGHAWQGENCPLLRDPLAREGFAEWVAYKVLQAQSLAKQMSLMRARTDLYGQGLRWALDIEAADGTGGVIEKCRMAR